MQLGQHSDTELMRLAKAGWSAAFAVLVHRYAPQVHAALRHEPDALTATTAVFIHAMRELRVREVSAPLGPWLLELIDRPPPAQPSALTSEELDAIWRELHRRWPDGDRPATTWPWRRLATITGLVVVAAAVPALVLGVEQPQEGDLELRAVPVTEERRSVETPDDDGLPSFSFPVAPEDDTRGEPEPQPEAAEPEPPSEPEPPPPPPASDPEPEPQPQPQPTTPEPDPQPTEDSSPLEDLLDPGQGDAEDESATDDSGSAGSGDAADGA